MYHVLYRLRNGRILFINGLHQEKQQRIGSKKLSPVRYCYRSRERYLQVYSVQPLTEPKTLCETFDIIDSILDDDDVSNQAGFEKEVDIEDEVYSDEVDFEDLLAAGEAFFSSNVGTAKNTDRSKEAAPAAPTVLSPEQEKVLRAVEEGRNVFYSGPAVSIILMVCIVLWHLIRASTGHWKILFITPNYSDFKW